MRYINGKDTIAVAKIAEYHVIVILKPYISRTQDPIGPKGPIVLSKKKPTTVGGSTIGSVKIQSRTPFTTPGIFAIEYAAKIPRKKIKIVEIDAIRSEL